MIARLGVFQTIAILAVALGIGGWVVYTQTDLLGREDAPVPTVAASDDPAAIKQEEEGTPPAEQTEEVAETASEAQETVDDSQEVSGSEEEQASVEEVVSEEPDEQEPAIQAPTFDVVRVESDGTTVVAGTAPAGWDISILVDGVEMVTVLSDASGQFVAFLDLGKSDQARVMTLRATNDQRVILSDAQVIIAPVITRVAEEETSADPEVAEVEVAEVTETEETISETEVAATDTSEQPQAGVEQESPTEDTATDEEQATDAEVVVAELDEAVDTDTSATIEAPAEEVASAEPEVEKATDTTDTTETSETSTTSGADSGSEDGATETAAVTETVEPTISTSDTTGAEEVEVAEDASAAETDEAPAEDASEVDAEDTDQAAEVETTQAPSVEDADVAEAEETETDQDTAPAVLLVDDDGVNILQPAAASPAILDELSIAAITYSENGAVFLTGFSPAGFLRVYINNKQVVVLEVPEPGEWKAELVGVEPGVYTLRVDQVDENGQVVQRVETPFKREEPRKIVEIAQTRKPLVSLEVVQPGSTLWAISREAYGSGVLFVRIFEANRDQIRNPDLIYPGQIFELPAPPGAKKKKRTSG